MIETAERRQFVLEKRKAGMTYREIASAAIKEFGREALPNNWDCRYAWLDVKRELDKLRNIIGEDAEDVRQMEVERLNDLLWALWPKATAEDADYGAIDRVLRVMKRRAGLLGLDAPERLEHSGHIEFDIGEWRRKRQERLEKAAEESDGADTA